MVALETTESHLEGTKVLWTRTDRVDRSFTLEAFDRLPGDGVQYEGGRLGNDRPAGEWESYKEEYDSHGRKTHELYWYYAKIDPNTGAVIRPGRSIETKWDYAGLDWSVDEFVREGSRDSQRDVRHTILYDTHATLSKYEKVWDWGGQTWTSQETQWNLAGLTLWQREEWLDTADTLNRSLVRHWDRAGTEAWATAEIHARGAADTLSEEVYRYDNGHFERVLHDLDDQHSGWTLRVQRWSRESLATGDPDVLQGFVWDDGTYSETLYDPGNATPDYKDKTTRYTTRDERTRTAMEEAIHHDDGTYTARSIDYTHTNPNWFKHAFTWTNDLMSVKLSEEFVFDDLRRQVEQFDRASQPWDTILTLYRAGDGLSLSETTTYDNNRIVIHEWDRAGTQVWAERIRTKANGVDLSQEKLVYSPTHYTLEHFDYARQQRWTTQLDTVKNGVKTLVEYAMDSGRFGKATPDLGHAAWDWMYEEFEDSAHTIRTIAYVVNDDGTGLLNRYDPKDRDKTFGDSLGTLGKDGYRTHVKTYFDAGGYKIDTWAKTATGFDHTYQEFNDDDTARTVKVNDHDVDQGGALPIDEDPFSTAPLMAGEDDRLAASLDADLAWMNAEIFARRIWSTSADERLTLGDGTDIVMLMQGFGHDTVTGFMGGAGRGDVLMFDSRDFRDAAAVLAAARQEGADVRITVDAHDSLVLRNLALASLSADDFRFMV